MKEFVTAYIQNIESAGKTRNSFFEASSSVTSKENRAMRDVPFQRSSDSPIATFCISNCCLIRIYTTVFHALLFSTTKWLVYVP